VRTTAAQATARLACGTPTPRGHFAATATKGVPVSTPAPTSSISAAAPSSALTASPLLADNATAATRVPLGSGELARTAKRPQVSGHVEVPDGVHRARARQSGLGLQASSGERGELIGARQGCPDLGHSPPRRDQRAGPGQVHDSQAVVLCQ